jgi:hypothetical protein
VVKVGVTGRTLLGLPCSVSASDEVGTARDEVLAHRTDGFGGPSAGEIEGRQNSGGQWGSRIVTGLMRDVDAKTSRVTWGACTRGYSHRTHSRGSIV